MFPIMKILPLNEVERTVAFSVCGRLEAGQRETEQRNLNKTRAGEVWSEEHL